MKWNWVPVQMFVLALAVAGGATVFQQRLALSRNVQRVKSLRDERDGIRKGKPVSAEKLGAIKFNSQLTVALDAEVSAPFDLGNYEFENTAVLFWVPGRKMLNRNPKLNFISPGSLAAVVSTGQTTQGDPNGTEFRRINLTPGSNFEHIPIPITTRSKTTGRPGPINTTLGTDNQIVKGKDGALYAFRNVTHWGPAPGAKPEWWDNTTIQGYSHGARVGTMVWKSTDGTNWERQGFIDPMNYLDGRYSVSRPVPQEPDGCPDGCFGGFDRMEAYADPYSGDLYVSVFAIGGQEISYPSKQVKSQAASTNMIFKSQDYGLTWKLVAQPSTAWTPMVMTSTPNGRLYIYSNVDTKPQLWYSTKNEGDNVELAGPYDVDVNGIPVGSDALYGDRVYKSCNSISRISTDSSSSKIRISYPAVDDNGRTMMVLANVTCPEDAGQPIVQPLKVIKGNKAAGNSVLCATFVDADVTIAKVGKNTALFYWLEGTGVPTPPYTEPDGKVSVNCMLVDGSSGTGPVKSLAKDLDRNYSVGHYIGSGSAMFLGKPNFFVHFPQKAGMRGYLVSAK